MAKDTRAQDFYRNLIEQLGPIMEDYKSETPEAARKTLLNQWEKDLVEAGLPNREKANLVALVTLIPYLNAIQTMTHEELIKTIVGNILILLDDVKNPN